LQQKGFIDRLLLLPPEVTSGDFAMYKDDSVLFVRDISDASSSSIKEKLCISERYCAGNQQCRKRFMLIGMNGPSRYIQRDVDKREGLFPGRKYGYEVALNQYDIQSIMLS
jgi:hypothetical protein